MIACFGGVLPLPGLYGAILTGMGLGIWCCWTGEEDCSSRLLSYLPILSPVTMGLQQFAANIRRGTFGGLARYNNPPIFG